MMIVSEAPSMIPTIQPSLEPTISPSNQPSLIPSIFPSYMLSFHPSMTPTTSPVVIRPQDDQTKNTPVPPNQVTPINNGNDIDKFDAAVIAAIVGATATLVSACFFLMLIWHRQSRKKKRNRSYPKEVALSTRDAHGNIVPIVVELGEDHLSLADTTLGDGEYVLHKSSRRALASQQDVRPLGSFDENSLYTTPFSIDPDGEEYRARIVPLPTQSSLSSTASSKQNAYDDHSGGIPMFADSNRNESPIISLSSGRTKSSTERTSTYSEYWKSASYVTRPPVTASSSARLSIPVDVDNVEPFYEITKIEPLDVGLSTVKEDDGLSSRGESDVDDDFTRDPSELDVW
jgi:hypothetical protein